MSAEKLSDTVDNLLTEIAENADKIFDTGYYKGYSDGYFKGETDGYDKGETDGYDKGETDGYDRGKTEGYAEGYSKGLEDGDGSGLDTSDADAMASDILEGKSAYVKGQKVVGAIPSIGETVFTPTESKRIIVQPHTYTKGAIIVEAIPDTFVKPSGSLSITSNGIHNVHGYEEVDVSVVGGSFDEEYINEELDAILAIQEPLLPLTFTLRDEIGEYYTLQFSLGMNWREWCATGYNTAGLLIKDGLLYTSRGVACVKDMTTNADLTHNTVIEAGNTYQAQ